MIRNLKALGLALVAMLALGAIGASGASAQQGKVTSETGEAFTLTGTETGVEKNRLTSFGAFVECPGSTYTGHKITATPHELIPNGSSQATLTPNYLQTKAGDENCKGPFGWSATVKTNGCDYNATIGETIAEHEYEVIFGVVCPKGAVIEVSLWTSKTEHTSKPTDPFCRIDVGQANNGALTGARAIDTSTTDGHIELVGEVTGITATKTNLRPGHSFLCANHETTPNAKFHLDATVSAHNFAGEPVPIKLSD